MLIEVVKHDICLAAKQIIWNQPKCSWMCRNAFYLWTLDLLKVEEAMWIVLRKHSFPNFKESLNFLPLWSFEDQSSLIFRGWDQSKNLYTGKVRIIKVYGSWCIIVYYDTMVATIMDKILLLVDYLAEGKKLTRAVCVLFERRFIFKHNYNHVL